MERVKSKTKKRNLRKPPRMGPKMTLDGNRIRKSRIAEASTIANRESRRHSRKQWQSRIAHSNGSGNRDRKSQITKSQWQSQVADRRSQRQSHPQWQWRSPIAKSQIARPTESRNSRIAMPPIANRSSRWQPYS